IVGFDHSERREAGETRAAPLAAMYETADGRTILLSILNHAKEWPKFAAVLGHPEWAQDARFQDQVARYQHREELHALIAAAFESDTAAAWREKLDRAGITYSLAQRMSEVIGDEQLHANDILTEVEPGDHFYAYTVNSPIWIDDTEKRTPHLAPTIGEHTREVLGEIGYSAEQVQQMLVGGIARQHDDT
ncbi:MAG: CoA transferase, partial [Gammaproteobacteria bacterium]|nr:CoA transferase [Gammaproteobacteria bacterium]